MRIPLKVLRTDTKNDLAVLSVDADLTSKPLKLSSEAVSPGEQVFAIGNPEGLEKTISQGIVSGLRNRGDRNLLQVTSPISHGSSGGPILNAKGEVVGVAVGMLEDGQNLNFAVPVEYVRAILAPQPQNAQAKNMMDSINEVRDLIAKRKKVNFSIDPSSDYQQETEHLIQLMNRIVATTREEGVLTEVSCIGLSFVDLSDPGVRAARKLVQVNPTPQHRALLSYLLYDSAEDEGIKSLLAEKDSAEQKQALAAKGQLLSEASHEASDIAKVAHGDSLLIADFVLGSAKDEDEEYADAIAFHAPVVNGSPQVCGIDLVASALRTLISESDSAKRPDEAEQWFRRYAARYQPSPYEWDNEGDRRAKINDYAGAANAYETAAAGSENLGYDYCYAASQHFLQTPTDSDGVMADGRKCIDASVKQTSDQDMKYFTGELPAVYMYMASVLADRGVYPSALAYVKESLAGNPKNAFALDLEARILEDTQQYSECIAAAQAAIRASDGKYPSMQFQLGQCYFDTADWVQAAASYRLAAEGDKTDAAAAFNLGLSLARQGYTSDASTWFREALRRNPSDELRAKIQSALR